MKKIILMLSILALSALIIGCGPEGQIVNEGDIPEGTPLPPRPPADTESAVAGQGVSTGSFDNEFQLYNMLYTNGRTIIYLVDGGWAYLGYLSVGDKVTRGDLTLTFLERNNPTPAPGSRLRLESSCVTYEIEMDGSGNYQVFRDGVTDNFNVPLNRHNGVNNRVLASSEDAITVHSASSGVGWWTLKCDEASPAPVCGDGNIDSGEQCDDGNTVSGDGCSATCQTEAAASSCLDSDGGNEPALIGRVNVTSGSVVNSYADICAGNTTLTEYTCSAGTSQANTVDCAGLYGGQGVCTRGRCYDLRTCNSNSDCPNNGRTYCTEGSKAAYACVAGQCLPTQNGNTCSQNFVYEYRCSGTNPNADYTGARDCNNCQYTNNGGVAVQTCS